MAHIQNVLILLALCVLTVTLAQVSQGGSHTNQGGTPTSQGGPHVNQGRARRQAQNAGVFDNWVPCDATVIPKISCYDCNTKLICKQIGGILKACNSPQKPYCTDGVCSAVPSAECS